MSKRYWIGLFLGPGLFFYTLFMPHPEGLSLAAWRVFGLALFMATWWVTEVVPIAVTALLPIIIAPLCGITSISSVSSSYTHPIIFLFLGGFMLGLAMERWQLHKRIALITLMTVSNKPSQQIAGFMGITAFLSMWVSNTTITIIMLPIAMVVIEIWHKHHPDSEAFEKSLLLAIAYSATIGGIASLIGTPPNALLAAFIEKNYQFHISFVQWMLFATPISLVMLLFTWFWLTKIMFPVCEKTVVDVHGYFEQEVKGMGAMSHGEKTTMIIFILTASAWLFRPLLIYVTGLPITDTAIATICVVTLFIIPAERNGESTFIMDWDTTKELPWGILFLFGGGLSLAALMQSSGLALWIASSLTVLEAFPTLLIVTAIVTMIIFLTEVTSNTTTTATFLPALGALAVSLNIYL